ncbi:MAG: hypothetical protein AB1540_14160 [Bdellovibrionota bacterium]
MEGQDLMQGGLEYLPTISNIYMGKQQCYPPVHGEKYEIDKMYHK